MRDLGIASLLSPRLWLLTEAKPRSIVRVEGTTNLLFPNTQSISMLLYRKTLDSLLNDHLKTIKTNKITHLLSVFCIINLNIVSRTFLCFASVNSQSLGDNKLAIPSYPVNKYILQGYGGNGFNGLSMLLLKWRKIVWSKSNRYFWAQSNR